MAIDINSIFNQGADYRIELVNERINFTSSKWAEIIYEISANVEAKEVSKIEKISLVILSYGVKLR